MPHTPAPATIPSDTPSGTPADAPGGAADGRPADKHAARAIEHVRRCEAVLSTPGLEGEVPDWDPWDGHSDPAEHLRYLQRLAPFSLQVPRDLWSTPTAAPASAAITGMR